MKNVTIGLLVMCALAAGSVACDKKDGGGAGGSATTTSGDSTGVSECDDYIKKYEGCLSKMPAASKPQMETAFKTTRDGFKTAAGTAEGKAALKTQCKTMLDALATNPMCK